MNKKLSIILGFTKTFVFAEILRAKALRMTDYFVGFHPTYELKEFLKNNPDLDENDFLESLGYDTSDIYGRVGINHHFWDLKGGDNNSAKSQSGYIKIGNINDKTQEQSAKDLNKEGNNLYNKLIKMSNDMKSSKPIEEIFKKEGEIGIMKGSEPFESDEINYSISEIVSNMSPEEKAKGYAVRKLGNSYTHLKYNKDGKHKLGKYQIGDTKYD